MRTTIIVILVILVVAVGAWFMFGSKDSPKGDNNTDSGTVAVVNGEEISQSEFDAAKVQIAAQQGLDPTSLAENEEAQLQEQVVNMLVSQTLLQQAASDADVKVADADVNTQVDQVKGQFENDEAYKNALSSQGLTEDEFTTQIKSDLAVQAYLEGELDLQSIEVTDDEINQVYEQQKATAGDNLPPLEEVRDQVKQLVVQQKQQQLVAGLVEKLRADAEVEIQI